MQSWALENGLSPGMLGVNRSNLDNLRGMIAFESLLPELPLETLPQTLVANASQSPDETPFNPVSNTAQVAEQKKQVEELIAGSDVGFAKALFFGKFKGELLFPYPVLPPDQQAKSDELLDGMGDGTGHVGAVIHRRFAVTPASSGAG